MFEETFARLGAARLEDGAVHPAVGLVVHGIGPLELREAAVLRLEGRLQVSRVVDGMGIGVAGEQFEALRKSLGEIKGHSVIPGVAVGELCVNAVEGYRHAEALGVAGQSRQSDLSCVSDGEGLSWRDKAGEGWLGAVGP